MPFLSQRNTLCYLYHDIENKGVLTSQGHYESEVVYLYH